MADTYNAGTPSGAPASLGYNFTAAISNAYISGASGSISVRLQIDRGQVWIWMRRSSTSLDFTSAFRTSGTLTLTRGSHSLVIPGSSFGSFATIIRFRPVTSATNPTSTQVGAFLDAAAADPGAHTITFDVPSPGTPELPTLSDITVLDGTTFERELPAATGIADTPISYTLTGLPNHFTFDQSTRLLRSTNTGSPATYPLTYKVEDRDGDSDEETFNLVVAAPAALSLAAVANIIVVEGNASRTAMPEAQGGYLPVTHSVTGLVMGITFDGSDLVTSALLSSGSYPLKLTAKDARNNVVSRDFTVTVSEPPNKPPVANAGPNQSVAAGEQFQLDASGSRDPDGQIVSHLWEQVSGPTVELSNNAAIGPRGTAPVQSAASELVYELTVTDDDGATATARVTISVAGTSVVGSVGTISRDFEIVSGAEISYVQLETESGRPKVTLGYKGASGVWGTLLGTLASPNAVSVLVLLETGPLRVFDRTSLTLVDDTARRVSWLGSVERKSLLVGDGFDPLASLVNNVGSTFTYTNARSVTASPSAPLWGGIFHNLDDGTNQAGVTSIHLSRNTAYTFETRSSPAKARLRVNLADGTEALFIEVDRDGNGRVGNTLNRGVSLDVRIRMRRTDGTYTSYLEVPYTHSGVSKGTVYDALVSFISSSFNGIEIEVVSNGVQDTEWSDAVSNIAGTKSLVLLVDSGAVPARPDWQRRRVTSTREIVEDLDVGGVWQFQVAPRSAVGLGGYSPATFDFSNLPGPPQRRPVRIAVGRGKVGAQWLGQIEDPRVNDGVNSFDLEARGRIYDIDGTEVGHDPVLERTAGDRAIIELPDLMPARLRLVAESPQGRTAGPESPVVVGRSVTGARAPLGYQDPAPFPQPVHEADVRFDEPPYSPDGEPDMDLPGTEDGDDTGGISGQQSSSRRRRQAPADATRIVVTPEIGALRVNWLNHLSRIRYRAVGRARWKAWPASSTISLSTQEIRITGLNEGVEYEVQAWVPSGQWIPAESIKATTLSTPAPKFVSLVAKNDAFELRWTGIATAMLWLRVGLTEREVVRLAETQGGIHTQIGLRSLGEYDVWLRARDGTLVGPRRIKLGEKVASVLDYLDPPEAEWFDDAPPDDGLPLWALFQHMKRTPQGRHYYTHNRAIQQPDDTQIEFVDRGLWTEGETYILNNIARTRVSVSTGEGGATFANIPYAWRNIQPIRNSPLDSKPEPPYGNEWWALHEHQLIVSPNPPAPIMQHPVEVETPIPPPPVVPVPADGHIFTVNRIVGLVVGGGPDGTPDDDGEFKFIGREAGSTYPLGVQWSRITSLLAQFAICRTDKNGNDQTNFLYSVQPGDTVTLWWAANWYMKLRLNGNFTFLGNIGPRWNCANLSILTVNSEGAPATIPDVMDMELRWSRPAPVSPA